jgi:hypothetical protein
MVACFGQVKIQYQGLKYIPAPPGPGGQPRTKQWGETYVASCPFCKGHEKLYINHAWRMEDVDTGSQRLWMAKCHRGCLDSYDRRCRLAVMLFEQVSLSGVKDVIVPGIEKPPVPPELPGELTRVDRLPAGHPVREYLTSRKFDVQELAEDRQISYCTRAFYRFRSAENRLIIPVYQNGKLAGWQARYLGVIAPGQKIPKYLTMTGMRKSEVLYGHDLAFNHGFVVICEGPTDCWRFGPEAVALFGKTMSPRQRDMIVGHPAWARNCIVVLLDADARAETDRIAVDLGQYARNVLRVDLPPGYDPADYSRRRLRREVFRLASQRGIDLASLERPCTGPYAQALI